jgi:hypothetical protein
MNFSVLREDEYSGISLCIKFQSPSDFIAFLRLFIIIAKNNTNTGTASSKYNAYG